MNRVRKYGIIFIDFTPYLLPSNTIKKSNCNDKRAEENENYGKIPHARDFEIGWWTISRYLPT